MSGEVHACCNPRNCADRTPLRVAPRAFGHSSALLLRVWHANQEGYLHNKLAQDGDITPISISVAALENVPCLLIVSP